METIVSPKLTKAIKEHKCMFCCQPITIGTKYFKSTHVADGEVYDWKTHQQCSWIADKLKMYDQVEEGVTTDDFLESIREEYASIMSKTQTELWESESFRIPQFSEQLIQVLNHHGAAGKIIY